MRFEKEIRKVKLWGILQREAVGESGGANDRALSSDTEYEPFKLKLIYGTMGTEKTTS